MHINALTDVKWIHTTSGPLSVKESLIQAHTLTGLDLSRPAYEISAQLRILEAIFAMVVFRSDKEVEIDEPVSTEIIDDVISDIGPAAFIDDPVQPFLQQPKVGTGNTKETAIGPGSDFPIKKLFPSTPPEQANEFWGLSTPLVEALELPEALLALAVFHCFSPAGNNAYAGQKCSMGSPGLRFPGKDNSATEFLWYGSTLLETLSMNTPKAFLDEYSLPAWADRTGERSCSAAVEPVLWAATWSSNAPVCHWDEGKLTGVRAGGIPENWYHLATMGTTKESRKQWWDLRNTQDPFYLYIKDKKGVLKAQRLDIGRDPTSLAVEWLADEKFKTLEEKRTDVLVFPDRQSTRLLFLRHLVGGTASSPSIRSSESLIGDQSTWAPNKSVADTVIKFADLVRSLHFTVCRPFRRLNVADKQKVKAGETPLAFDSLEHRYQDASTAFWRNVSALFSASLEDIARDGIVSEETLKELAKISLATFDEIVEPHLAQLGPLAPYVRGNVRHFISSTCNKFSPKGTDS